MLRTCKDFSALPQVRLWHSHAGYRPARQVQQCAGATPERLAQALAPADLQQWRLPHQTVQSATGLCSVRCASGARPPLPRVHQVTCAAGGGGQGRSLEFATSPTPGRSGIASTPGAASDASLGGHLCDGSAAETLITGLVTLRPASERAEARQHACPTACQCRRCYDISSRIAGTAKSEERVPLADFCCFANALRVQISQKTLNPKPYLRLY